LGFFLATNQPCIFPSYAPINRPTLYIPSCAPIKVHLYFRVYIERDQSARAIGNLIEVCPAKITLEIRQSCQDGLQSKMDCTLIFPRMDLTGPVCKGHRDFNRHMPCRNHTRNTSIVPGWAAIQDGLYFSCNVFSARSRLSRTVSLRYLFLSLLCKKCSNLHGFSPPY